METATAATTESAPVTSAETESRQDASPSIPRDAAAYAEWRKTGKTGAKPKADSTPAKKEPVKDSSETVSDSEPGNDSQEKAKPRSTADTRLQEILADLKKAGLSPAELKSFKREAQQKAPDAKETPKPEQTAKPAQTEEKKAPKLDDFNTYDEYIDAKAEFIADKRAQDAVRAFRDQMALEAAGKAMQERIDAAKARYGEEAESKIGEAGRAIYQTEGVNAIVKGLLRESPVFVDLLYTIGSKPEDMAAFIEEARTNPGAAIRRVVLFEKLVQEELAKAGKTSAEESAEDDSTPRDSSGKFSAPAKKTTSAPAPPREVSGRASAPEDAVESASRRNDFSAYREAANRRDMQRRKAA